MKQYWNNLNDRERWIVTLGCLICLIYVGYFFIYAPLINSVNRKVQQLDEKTATLAWMKQARMHYTNSEAPEVLTSGQLLSHLASQLKTTAFNHYTYQLQQTGDGNVQLSFDKVPFSLVLSWLKSLQKKYSFVIKQILIERTDTSGIVKMLVILGP